jgi:quercetin dioxygenase-like cupin family protein
LFQLWLEAAGEGIMVDQEVIGNQLKTNRFPFQSEGDITLAVRNANYTLGPVMLHIVMKPDSSIPAHLHKGMAEALYVVEGDFTNEGKQYQAGTSLHFKAGKEHGPHATKNGCKLLILWTEKSSKEAAQAECAETRSSTSSDRHGCPPLRIVRRSVRAWLSGSGR